MRRRNLFFVCIGGLLFSSGVLSKNNCDQLPTRIVVTAKGTKKVAPSVWLQESKKVLNPSKYSVSVEKGDTVYSLAKKHGVSIRDIITYNHLHPPFGLSVGQSLTLSNPKTHKVLKGETLYSIANKHSVDVSALAHRNQLKAPFKLLVGQDLILPGSIPLDDRGISIQKTSPKPKALSPKKERSVSVQKQQTPKKKAEKPKNFIAPPRGSAHFLRPVAGKVILPFGPSKNGTLNDGINIAAASGTIVKASENGVVIYKGNDLPSYGNMVLLKHSGGWVTAYAHLKAIDISKGETVKRGQRIGTVGTTGHVKFSQLHFELRRGRTPVNPVSYLRG